MYTKLEKAIYFATKAHQGQKRKNDDIDVIFHPFSVGIMIKDIGLPNDYVIISILHDIIEDTEHTYNDIENYFGAFIANGVLKLSENKKIKKWLERKEEFLNRLKQEEDINILLIECADKLHNLLSDYDLDRKTRENSYSNLEEQRWFYLSLKDILEDKIKDSILFKRYKEICNNYFL